MATQSRGRRWLRLCFIWLALLAGLAPAAASAQVKIAQSVTPKACIMRAPDAQLPSGQEGDAGFAVPQLFDCQHEQASYGRGDFWVLLPHVDTAAQPADPLVLRMPSVWQDSLRFNIRYADGHIERLGFTSATASQYITIGAMFEIPIPYRESAVRDILVETRGSANLRGVVLGAKVMPLSAASSIKLWLAALYAGFAGLIIALVIYNLSLWVALRHQFQLFYCGMAAAMCAHTFSASGALMLCFDGVANNDRLRVNYALLSLTGVMAMLFFRAFFGPDLVTRWLKLATQCVVATVAVSGLAYAILSPWQQALFDRMFFGSFIIGIALMTFILWRALRLRTPSIGLFLLAWSFPLVAGLLRTLHGVGLLDYSFWLDNSSVVAVAIEALVSSIVIANRIRMVAHERDQARAEESVARIQANEDPLTGLLNRRAFLEQIIGQPGTCRLMLLDIDRFKLINDLAGHLAGDEVLQRLADTLRQWQPEGGIVARLGGEEFAVVLPENAPDATAVSLLEAVRNASMPQGLKVTVSIGLTEGNLPDEEAWTSLYRRADTALYRAKADGRDRVCRATRFQLAA
jgi:diguanylate cyclase (GGDEF)-like protein